MLIERGADVLAQDKDTRTITSGVTRATGCRPHADRAWGGCRCVSQGRGRPGQEGLVSVFRRHM